jgi:hypothetical protein
MGDTATERGIQARTYPLYFKRKTFFPIDSKVDQITYRFQSMTINEEFSLDPLKMQFDYTKTSE